MNRVIDLPALHVYFWERARNSQVTVPARELAESLGVSPGTIYTTLRELTSQGRLVFLHKNSERHPVYTVTDPAVFGTPTVVRQAPTAKVQAETVGKRGRPAWG